MQLYELLGHAVVNICILSASITIAVSVIKAISRKRMKRGNKSSFVINTNDKNLSTKYKDLDIKSFDAIGGLAEVKEELKKYVKCFDNKEAFSKQNVGIPRGILLWGPPGCGKTSLAKAIAYEARVNFICKNASDLIDDHFRGMATKNSIEQLFEDARKLAPCILFIDELDVIGCRYDQFGSAGGHQVEITRLLAEMDGFQNNEDIMVIAATNDSSKIDRALLRSGRLGKKYFVGPPTSKSDILEIVNMYIKGKNLDAEITDDVLATLFRGYSPADIKAVLNECAVKSVLDGNSINVDMVRHALMEVDLSTNLGNLKNVSNKRRTEAARHESGHAIVSAALGVPVQVVTILGTSNGVRGLTKSSQAAFTDEDIKSEIIADETILGSLQRTIICYGGLAVELLDGKEPEEISLGCTSDLDKATKIINELVEQTNYKGEVYANISAISVEDKGKRILDILKDSQETAISILRQNKELLDTLSEELEANITLADSQLQDILCKVKPWDGIMSIKE